MITEAAHRSAGRADHADVLSEAADRETVVRFLRSIDRSTTPFLTIHPPEDVCGRAP